MESSLELVIRVGDVRYTVESARELRDALDREIAKWQAVMEKLKAEEPDGG